MLEHIPSAKRDQKLKSILNGATCYDLCIKIDPGLYTFGSSAPLVQFTFGSSAPLVQFME